MFATGAPTTTLHAIVAAAPMIHYTLDQGGVFTLCVGGGLAAIGLRPEDLLGRSAFAAFAEAPDAVAACRRALAGEDTEEFIALAGRTFRIWQTPTRDADRLVIGVYGLAIDITAERRAEDVLREDEARPRAMLDALHEGVVLQDANGRIVAANPAAERLLGLTAAELLGLTSYDPRWRAMRQDGTPYPTEELPTAVAMRTGVPQRDVVCGVHTSHGDLLWVLVTAQPLLHPGAARPHGVVVSFVDITERKRMEDALRVSEARHRALVDHSTNAVLLTTPDGQVLSANLAACRMFGRTEEELRRLGRVGLVDPDDPRLPALLAERARVGRFQGELTHFRRDGTRFPAEVVSVVFRDRDGQERASTIIRDISARIQAETALRQSEEHFRSAFAHAAIGMALVGLDGHWLRVNRALCALTGYDEEALLATDFQALTHPDDLALDLQQVAALLAGAIETYQMEKRYRHQDGRYIWVLLSVSLVRDEQETPVHFISQIQDIDGRKRAEEALRASEERHRALLAAAERQAQELRLLDKVRTALARELDPAAVVRVVVEGIAATFGYTQVSLYLREGEEHVLQHQVGYDRVLARIPITDGVSGRAVREDRAILLGDVAADRAFLGAIEGVTSEICVPLHDAGQPAGFLNVESTGGVRLDEADLRLMVALGEQVGIALERARLHEELREREARLAHLALHDPLTGLPNRRGLGEALRAALARQRRGGPPVALLYIDLDDFKGVNDALGHEAGDYLLGEVADRLRACLRAGDTAGRLGGDEFAILLEGAGTDAARVVAARVVAALAAPVRIGAATATVSASVGAALAAVGETADDVLRRADTALYGAKRAGKNQLRLAAD